jgi:membrane-bound lytic murein transglycosylase D
MTKTKLLNKIILIFLLIVLFSVSSTYAVNVSYGNPEDDFDNLEIDINKLKGFIDAKYTNEVGDYVNSYTRGSKFVTEEFLGKIPVYFPFFEEKLKEANLPDELKVLAIVESHLKNNAYSPAGAAGIWQFVAGTATNYGIKVSKTYDGRYNVEESTEAAIKYLKDLYATFDNWTLVMAAYNCGAGAVKNAISKAGGSTDFWRVVKYLPKETRNYVPKFIALTYVLNNFTEYSLKPLPAENHFYDNAQAIVYKHMDFKYISNVTGIPLSVIKELNFAYRKGFIPANSSGHKLILPKSALFALLEHENFNKIEFDKELNQNYSQYIMNYFPRDIAGYLLGNEAVYNVSESISYNFDNKVRNNNPGKLSIEPMLPRNKSGILSKNDENYIIHKLKAGESLMDVAKKYDDVKLSDIMRWNGFSMTKTPKPGSKIKIKK